MNQKKINALKIVPFDLTLKDMLENYLEGIDLYYLSSDELHSAINIINEYYDAPDNLLTKKQIFYQKPSSLKHHLLTPQHLSTEYGKFLENVKKRSKSQNKLIELASPQVGNEIGSANYLFEGTPFIKTSDCINYNVDYEPNYFCSEVLYHELEQDVHSSDILIAKDGKIGETAFITDNSRFVYCSGLVKLQSGDYEQQLLLFALLSSMVGQVQARMWTVIASTMAHLRADFFRECLIPELPNNIKDEVIKKCRNAMELRRKSFIRIKNSKDNIEKYILSL